MAIDEFRIGMAREIGAMDDFAEPLGRHRATLPDDIERIATGLLALERIDAPKAQPLRRTAEPELGGKAMGGDHFEGIAIDDVIAIDLHLGPEHGIGERPRG
jgi:hypothetical protein